MHGLLPEDTPPATERFSIFVRWLSGDVQKIKVAPDSPIDTLLGTRAECVAEFHKVKFFHLGNELLQRTVGDCGLSNGCEVNAMICMPEESEIMREIVKHRDAFFLEVADGSGSESEKSENNDAFHVQRCAFHVQRCVAAIRFLSRFESLDRYACDELFAILTYDDAYCGTEVSAPMGVAIGEVFGRMCNPAARYLPGMMDYVPDPQISIALDEIDARGTLSRKERAALMRRWSFRFRVDLCRCREAMLALSRLVARMHDPNLTHIVKTHLREKIELVGYSVYWEIMKILDEAEDDEDNLEESEQEECQESDEEADEESEQEEETDEDSSQEGMEDKPAYGGSVQADDLAGTAQAQEGRGVGSCPEVSMSNPSDPTQEEQADLLKAVLLSKAENSALSGDDVVIFRLTRYSQEIEAALCTATELTQRVNDAGCQVRPSFSEGIFLVPITLQQYRELGLDLQKHHVLALRSDREDITEALRPVPKTKRPRLHVENHARVADLQACPAEEPYPFTEERVLDHVARLSTNEDGRACQFMSGT
eukprot:TRINITY_DN9172_c0_g1_i6.p1 TRINITY_DN9172_c0_g1~~TRINITY_DN9172_c0_g1_i6.p1  ORF type:complete len:557 (-),score=78.14 TRINITY_DN9172_c0_g1_i6:630-2246(-)